MLLSIIIVNWNSWNYLFNCITSIITSTSITKLEIIVVDNSSIINRSEEIKLLFSNIIFIHLNKNLGFSEATNLGIRSAQGKYLLLLNPDTLVYPNTLERSIAELESNLSIGCLGVKVLKGDGAIYQSAARKHPTLRSLVFNLLYLNRIFCNLKFFSSPNIDYWDHDSSRYVDMLHGGFMLIPREIIQKVGYLDSRLMMFYEDGEYCLRLQKYGYKIFYLADVHITHFIGGSTELADSKWINEMRHESWYLLLREYNGRVYSIGYLLAVIIFSPISVILLSLLFLVAKRKVRDKIRYERCYIIHSITWAFKKIFLRKEKK